jgi:hypothetical protein
MRQPRATKAVVREARRLSPHDSIRRHASLAYPHAELLVINDSGYAKRFRGAFSASSSAGALT